MFESVRSRIDNMKSRLPGDGWLRWIGRAVLLYLLLAVLVGMYWSIAPSQFDVEQRAADFAAERGLEVVTGSTTTAALIGVAETLLDKPAVLFAMM